MTLVGGAPVAAGTLAAALALAPEAVAADGGGDVVLPPGHRFRAVIGDMDSLAGAERLRAAGTDLFPIAEQDSTDLEKCLRSIDAPLVIGVGFLGGRIDHTLAAANALVRHAAVTALLLGEEDVCFLCPPRLALDLPAETRVSFFPMAPVRGLVSEGLAWSVEGLELRPDGAIGTSNRTTGGPVRVGFDAPRVLVLLPADCLPAAVAALA